MTSLEAYDNFLIKINRNDTQSNLYVDVSTFIQLFNRQKDKWVDNKLNLKDSIQIDDLQEIVTSKIETDKISTTEYDEYPLADNWYEFIGGNVLANQGDCKRYINLRPVKLQNVQIQNFDDSLEPSFDYEWTTYSLQDNKIRVYKKDFKTENISYTYYKVVPDIDIEGYIKADNTLSTTINPILKTRFVDEILDMCATEYFRNIQSRAGFELSKERQLNN